MVSKRLNRLAMMVTEGNRLADVGTDHGYVPILLFRQKRIPSAIAMDVNPGPLLRAEQHIQEYGVQNYIETRLSDGLAALASGEADTVLIAGMGGALTVRILTEGQKVLDSVRELVLQPQSEIGDVRKWLAAHGYRIICEDIVLDEGKYYPMMKAIHGEDTVYSDEEYQFGRLRLQHSLDTLMDYLKRNLTVQRQIQQELPLKEEPRIQKRRLETEQEIKRLEKVLEACEKLYAEKDRKEEKV